MNVEKAPDTMDEKNLKEEILKVKKQKGAVIMAHYYQPAAIQEIADYIGDSLALAQIAATTDADMIVMCGVNFMGETAKVLCPEKKVVIPDDNAGCSLADSCKTSDLETFISQHPGHTVISYVNTTASVKALTDVVVTSGNARKIVESFPADEKIIFGPDRNLGDYINRVTGRNMVLWDGACHVHERFSLEKVEELRKLYPQARLLVHPECRRELQLAADKVGSTAVLLDYAIESDCDTFLVATESGILHEMQKKCPQKRFIPVPPADGSAPCNECDYMKLTTLRKLLDCMVNEQPEVVVDTALMERARKPIERMLELSKKK